MEKEGFSDDLGRGNGSPIQQMFIEHLLWDQCYSRLKEHSRTKQNLQSCIIQVIYIFESLSNHYDRMTGTTGRLVAVMHTDQKG